MKAYLATPRRDISELQKHKGIWRRYWGIATNSDKDTEDRYNAITALIDDKRDCYQQVDEFSHIEESLFILQTSLNSIFRSGFEVYYDQSDSLEFYKIPALLRFIGASEASVIFENTYSRFGDAGPEKDFKKRTIQIAKLEGKLWRKNHLEFISENKFFIDNEGEIQRKIIDYFMNNLCEVRPPRVYAELI